MFNKQEIPRWLLAAAQLLVCEGGGRGADIGDAPARAAVDEAESELVKWVTESIQALGAAFPGGNYQMWEQCTVLLPHLKEVAGHRTGKKEDLMKQAESVLRAGWCLLLRDIRERVLGQGHPDTLTSVSELGLVWESQGKYEEAEAMHCRALEGYEEVLGREHPDTPTSVSELGLVLESQGKYEEAEAMHCRALEEYEEVLGREHPDTPTSVSELGLVWESQGKYEEAEAMHCRALEGYEEVLGREHPDTPTSVSELGLVWESQGKYEEAEAMHCRALEGYEEVLGQGHPDTLTSVSRLRNNQSIDMIDSYIG
ncbi:TadD, Flp pilus assembly protein TadD [Pyrenophora tritici-repentis]|uniref:TadD, Flp pilus assembly protein TadD n=2 Tax=Pyrenophora tritici-repentis TaxID=45151 RepID=A0A834RM41_9PLEO|nr:TadD, Flp pilus assembly protein TadD [Pyrenophora tritici-repentis]